MNKNFYNKMSAQKLGWEPEWFGEDDFDDELTEKIKIFQRSVDLVDDGLLGPMTYRRLTTQREAERATVPGSSSVIICEETEIPIRWNKVVTLTDRGNLALPKDCYKSIETYERVPSMIVTHWDAALSAESCYRILKKRGISSHFVIDNDGTIYQMVDTQHVGWHAGNRAVNNKSIGIDFSNAYYPKYQDFYEKRGHGPRPVLSDSVVHGRKLKPHLGYYPVQIEAYKALLECLTNYYHSIPLQYPTDENGELITGVVESAKEADFKGVVCHYHLTNKKIDCAGLKLDKIINDIRY
jgi:hypothetical protein